MTNPYRGFNKINTNYGVRGAADLSFQMVPDAQGNQVPLILPIYRSTSTDLTTPLIIAGTLLAGGLYLGPGATAGAAGTGAATGATAGTAAATGAAAGTGALPLATSSTGIGPGVFRQAGINGSSRIYV
jgi:hypothetical protein